MKTLTVKPQAKKAPIQIKAKNSSTPVDKEEVYSPEFIASIVQAREESKKGQLTHIEKKDLHDFLGL